MNLPPTSHSHICCRCLAAVTTTVMTVLNRPCQHPNPPAHTAGKPSHATECSGQFSGCFWTWQQLAGLAAAACGLFCAVPVKHAVSEMLSSRITLADACHHLSLHKPMYTYILCECLIKTCSVLALHDAACFAVFTMYGGICNLHFPWLNNRRVSLGGSGGLHEPEVDPPEGQAVKEIKVGC